jgi:hypothetical protein
MENVQMASLLMKMINVFLVTPDALRAIILMKMMKVGGVSQIRLHVRRGIS